MRISDWSSDVCSSDLRCAGGDADGPGRRRRDRQGRAAVETDRQFRKWRRPYRSEGRARQGHRRDQHPRCAHRGYGRQDRKSVVEGKSVSVRLDLGGRRIIKQKTTIEKATTEKN